MRTLPLALSVEAHFRAGIIQQISLVIHNHLALLTSLPSSKRCDCTRWSDCFVMPGSFTTRQHEFLERKSAKGDDLQMEKRLVWPCE